ncbi:MAG: type II secretion system protein [Patescibacteria group bacterium]
MKTKKGFTLIELLVVIAIIGILSSIGLVALNGAKEKARDAKKKNDLTQYRNALLMYFDGNGDKYYDIGSNIVKCVDDLGALIQYNVTYANDITPDKNPFKFPGDLMPAFLSVQLKPLKANDEASNHYCYDINDDLDSYILYTKLESGDKLWYWINDENASGTESGAHVLNNCDAGDCRW